MQIQDRIYPGKQKLPSPVVQLDQDGGLLVVAHPWGPRASAEAATQVLMEHYLSARVDQEVTMPFDRLTCLSSMANDIRIATKVTNDSLYHLDNREEYRSGIELFTLAASQQEFAIVQIGGPHAFYLKKENPRPICIGTNMGLPLEFSKPNSLPAPLPGKLLGIETTSNFAVNEFRYCEGDQIILLSRVEIPTHIYNVRPGEVHIEQLAQTISSENPAQAFWLAVIDL